MTFLGWGRIYCFVKLNFLPVSGVEANKNLRASQTLNDKANFISSDVTTVKMELLSETIQDRRK